jgi:hypothetical protein
MTMKLFGTVPLAIFCEYSVCYVLKSDALTMATFLIGLSLF